MTGYTPLFASLTSGTLCGKWPDVGLWPIVLSLADRHGIVDVTPDFLARVTGLPVADVAACMQRFCEPDPYSRSRAEDGARLVLVDPEHRNWGWRVVNHSTYREKARLAAKNERETASGANAARLAERRAPPGTAESESGPPGTAADPLSDKTIQDKNNTRRLHDGVIAAYHEILPDLPQVKTWSRKRSAALDARIRERCKEGKPADTVDYWRTFFEHVALSDFLCGRSGDWRADLEWLITAGNFTKVIEGKYENRSRSNGAPHAR